MMVRKPLSLKKKTSAELLKASGDLPDWVGVDNKVLKFTCYFSEKVFDSNIERERIRRCDLCFFLDDDTIQIAEEKQINSGISQGVLLRRQKVPKTTTNLGTTAKFVTATPNLDDHYVAKDLNIGEQLQAFGRAYNMIDCDHFTRRFLEEYMKMNVPDPLPCPTDDHTEYRDQILKSLRPVRPPREYKTDLKKFLMNDGKVLKFFCVWNDLSKPNKANTSPMYSPSVLYADSRRFVLLYFLSDDTIQVIEQIPPNSGRDPAPVFIKRQPVPDYFPAIESLLISSTFTMFNRTFLIVDYDPVTQEYFRSNFGIQDFTPLVADSPAITRATTSMSYRDVPKHTGFGTEEDSLASCLSLVPKPPRRDWNKLVTNDKKVLRFSGQFVPNSPGVGKVDLERKFVVTYYLADDTILIFEPEIRNSGIVSGKKFLERMRVKKPVESAYSNNRSRVGSPTLRPSTSPSLSRSGSPSSFTSSMFNNSRPSTPSSLSPSRPGSPGSPNSSSSAYYSPSDFYVGAVIDIFGRKIVLTDAAEFVFSHMEANPDEFPKADLHRIIEYIKEQIHMQDGKEAFIEFFRKNDRFGKGFITTDQFKTLMKQTGLNLTDQEIITLVRRYDLDDDGKISIKEFCSMLDDDN
eukprot:TRINITY_DN331_c0_g1_i2.p1 TRINITY_DN331_c0_g1~~TRINITY_DN331_c0_g1_i2.p1  ORF type:complete len:632 (+),score=147.75 TRINITY_DN331_c0_g1_i2:262-2157(+)